MAFEANIIFGTLGNMANTNSLTNPNKATEGISTVIHL